MRIKFLSVIVSFLFVSFAITSCLDSDNANIEYSSDATIHAFAIDSAGLGGDYKFTIDQIRGKIYNQDSLPVGSDTIIDRVLIKTLTTASGIVTMKNKNNEDSIINIADSIDLSTLKYNEAKPLVIKVWAPDMVNTKEYKLWVQVHLQDPDSLNWGSKKDEKPIATSFSGGNITGSQKAVILNKEIFVYSKSTANTLIAYKANTSDATNWRSVGTVSGLPATVSLSSIVSFNGFLYAVADGKIYSTENGADWHENLPLNQNGYTIHTLLASYPPRKATTTESDQINITIGISAILTYAPAGSEGTKTCFAMTDGNAAHWTIGDEVPNGFPKYDISSTAYITDIGVQGAMLMGSEKARAEEEETKKPITPWGSYDGKSWADLSTVNAFCPILTIPSILHYGSEFYAFGNDFATFYASMNGIAWYEANKKFYFPAGLKARTGSSYSMVVDDQNFIWIICSKSGSGSDDVWRARLNKLGFKNALTQ